MVCYNSYFSVFVCVRVCVSECMGVCIVFKSQECFSSMMGKAYVHVLKHLKGELAWAIDEQFRFIGNVL